MLGMRSACYKVLEKYINDNIILYIERFEIMYKENSYTKTS